MKILALSQSQDPEIAPFGVELMTDSTLLKDGKPFFIPDFSAQFTATPAIAIHICRLGKNIAGKFASRYYDSIGLGLLLRATGTEDALIAASLPTTPAFCFDGAAILGSLFPINSLTNSDVTANIQVNGNTVWEFPINEIATAADTAIEYLSKYCTMKIGDLLYFRVDGAEPLPLELNMQIEGYLQSLSALSLRVK